MICFSSGGHRLQRLAPELHRSVARPAQTTLFRWRRLGSLSGKSSRKWPPRLSLRSMAARAMASDTVSRLCRSSAV